MRKSNQGNANGYPRDYISPIAVDTEVLQTVLGCGRKSAVEIGTSASAKVVIGRRCLWNLAKIQTYLDEISTD